MDDFMSFPATFPGICEACLYEIEHGDLIVSDGDGGYLHDGCSFGY